MTINNLNEVEEMWGVSGVEDVKAYKRVIHPIPYTLFSHNTLSKEMEKLALLRLY